MSWDVWLYDDRGHNEGDWNYTHNVNPMIGAALVAIGNEGADQTEDNWFAKAIGPPWFMLLHGMDGPVGAKFLHEIITQLRSDPDKYRAMNPENGWGDYDSLLKVLTAMRDAVPEWPTTWGASG